MMTVTVITGQGAMTALSEKPRVAAGLRLNALAVLAGQLMRVQVWPPQNMPPKAQP